MRIDIFIFFFIVLSSHRQFKQFKLSKMIRKKNILKIVLHLLTLNESFLLCIINIGIHTSKLSKLQINQTLKTNTKY